MFTTVERKAIALLFAPATAVVLVELACFKVRTTSSGADDHFYKSGRSRAIRYRVVIGYDNTAQLLQP
jgi:hypothetical protein